MLALLCCACLPYFCLATAPCWRQSVPQPKKGVVLSLHKRLYACRVVARNELDQILQHQHIASPVPLLVMANKQDLEGAMPAAELAQGLQLDNIRDRPWQIVATNALTGDGLNTGTDWLLESLNSR